MTKTSAASTPKTVPVAKPSLASPLTSLDWKDLTEAQKAALKPLSGSWDHMGDRNKKKWISLSANFSTLSTIDKNKLQERMGQWAALTPKQREHARLNFADVQKIPPQQKSEQWQAYQALPLEARLKLAKSAEPKPPRTALAPKPVASDTMNKMPSKVLKARVAMTPSSQTHHQTLLARPMAPVTPPPIKPLVASEPHRP